MGKPKNMHPSRVKVLEAFRKAPLSSVRELAQAVGTSAASVSLHLCALEQDGLIVRPKLVRTWNTASAPSEGSKQWNTTKQGAIQRGEGAMKPRKAKGADALQARIDEVVKNAEKEGSCFRADYLKLVKLGGCKCG